MSDAITSVYIVIAVWMPVTVVSRSFATVAIAVFITVVSRAITNWPAASVPRTTPLPTAARSAVLVIAALSVVAGSRRPEPRARPPREPDGILSLSHRTAHHLHR